MHLHTSLDWTVRARLFGDVAIVDFVCVVPAARMEHTLRPKDAVGRHQDALLFDADAPLQAIFLASALVVEIAVVTANAAVATVLITPGRQDQPFGESRSALMAFDLERADLLEEVSAVTSEAEVCTSYEALVQALEAAIPDLNVAVLSPVLNWAVRRHCDVAPTTVLLCCCVMVASHAFLGVLFAAGLILPVDIEPVLPMAAIVWMIRTRRYRALQDDVRIIVPLIAVGCGCGTHYIKLFEMVIICSKLHPVAFIVSNRQKERSQVAVLFTAPPIFTGVRQSARSLGSDLIRTFPTEALVRTIVMIALMVKAIAVILPKFDLHSGI
jgi:hypothetical protein